MATAERTLVKSQPELWELIDEPNRIQTWSSGLLGYPVRVEVTTSEPEDALGWEAAGPGGVASVEVELDQDGWGTTVSISAEREGATPIQLEGWLEAVLDELAEPEKRPFQGIL